MDYTSAFIHAPLREGEEIYVSIPPGFEIIEDKLQSAKDSVYQPSKYVLKLKRSIYRLRQSPLTWFEFLSKGLVKQGLSPAETDPCLFIKEGVN